MALQNNLYPDIQFEEINDSPRPASIGSINRIGTVGTFRKGPNGVFKLRSTFSEFSSTYSATTHLGSVSVQAAMDQGANDFGLIRVMGSAKKSVGTFTFTVPVPASVTAGDIVFYLDEYNTSNILQNSYSVNIPVLALSTAADIANVAVSTINASTSITALIDAVYDSGGTVDIQASTAGLAGNFLQYTLRLSDTTPPAGVTVTPTNNGVQASGTATVAGTIVAGENFTVTLAGVPYLYTAVALDTPTSVAAALAALINPVVGYGATSALGVVTITRDAVGSAGNAVTLTVSTDSVAGTIVASGPTLSGGTQHASTNMTAGADGPKKSSTVLQDSTVLPADLIVLSAAYDGLWGDNIQVTTSPGTVAGKFNLFVLDTETDEEASFFDLDVTAASLDINNELIALKNSDLVRAVFVGTNNSLTPSIVTSLNLTGGTEGPAIIDQDYIDALTLLKAKNVNIILAAGQTSNTIRANLLAQAETGDAISGYRFAVLNADKNMDIASLNTVTSPFNTTTGSGVMVAGWCTYAGQTRLARFGASPDGFYAGHVAVTAVQVSPAARSSSPFFANVVEVDTETTSQAFNAYTVARMEAIINDPATGGFHCLNGRTLSSDGAWYWISVRRVYNQIKTDLFRMVQWVKSQPNTVATRNQLAQQLDTYMGILLSRGVIANTKPSQVDSTNNPPDRVASGFLRAEVFFTPVFPADHIIIGIRRFLSADVLTSVGA